MADASYDVVIVGGGHNGLVTGCYIALNGLSVAVFERQHELGGGACSEELPLPGFVSNPCAHTTSFHRYPVYSDFALAEMGLDLIFPTVGTGATFPDGTAITPYPAWIVSDKVAGKIEFSPKNAERTCNSIARISQRDAETAQFLYEKLHTKWLPAIAEVSYNPPKPWGQKNAIENLMDDPDSGFEPVYSVMTSEQLAREFWESPEMQCFFIRRLMATIGLFGESVLGAVNAAASVTIALSVNPPSIPTGGTHSITHALQRALSKQGGKFFVHSEVDKVLIENGTARGIRLTDGTEIEAKKMVISNLDIDQTINRLIGSDQVSPKIARRARNVKCDQGCIFWANVALNELPRYKAEDYDPEFYWCYNKVVLPKDPDYIASKHKAEIWCYGIPKQLALYVCEDTRWTAAKSPEGKHNVLVENYTAPRRLFSEREWLKMKAQFAEELIRQWQWYAPNMTRDNILGFYTNTPDDVEKRNINMHQGQMLVQDMTASQMDRFRPIPELSSYRMPVSNMYLASAAASGGGALRSFSGHICYKVIAQDFGLRKVWEEKGRPY